MVSLRLALALADKFHCGLLTLYCHLRKAVQRCKNSKYMIVENITKQGFCVTCSFLHVF